VLWRLLALTFFVSPAAAFVTDAKIVLSGREATSLRGFWDFAAEGKTHRLRVDKEWRLQGLPHVSRGTFSLAIDVPPSLRSGDFAVMLPPVSAAVRILLNGVPIADKGKVLPELRYPQNSSEAFSWYPVKAELLRAEPTQILTLEITGFHGGGGVYGNAHIYFGGLEAIKDKYNFIFLITAFLSAAMFMIAVFHFALVSDRIYRRANLHYVLLSLAMSAHILGMNGLGYYLWNDFIFNAALIHLLVAAFPFALTGFTLRYFQLKYPLIRRFAYIYGAAMTLFLVTIAVFPDLIPLYLNFGLPLGVMLMAASLVFAIFGAVQGVIRETEGAKLVLIGLLTYGLAVLNDVVFYFYSATQVKLADAGFLVTVVCVALALAQRLQRSAFEKEELRDWKKEVSLAAQIQNLALPRRSILNGNLQIETLFKPMKIIGGDFFGFHEVSENMTGILIADVSGHGIAAALMVNTLNTVFLQQREHASDPAALMQKMNAELYPHLQEQFVTAAYCLLDFQARKILIAQAGHPPIYLLRRDGKGLDRIKPKGRFFGFLPQLSYEIAELSMTDYARLFLYSDGVIEAGAIQGRPYSVSRLEKFLLDTGALAPAELLAALDTDIRSATRTAMNRDDDSSCVVVDLLRAA
jgi:sigma-B regulation protein RsbU (phosphoserine phosphatase)